MGFELSAMEKEYAAFAKKYSLPSFQQLNEDFEIDKIDRETRYILRLIRKVMMEKIVNSINFLELLINPLNTPRIYQTYSKNITAEDRRVIEQLYQALGALSIGSLNLEIDLAEKREAGMINEIYNTWQKLKPGFRTILKSLKQPNGPAAMAKKESKSYFG